MFQVSCRSVQAVYMPSINYELMASWVAGKGSQRGLQEISYHKFSMVPQRGGGIAVSTPATELIPLWRKVGNSGFNLIYYSDADLFGTWWKIADEKLFGKIRRDRGHVLHRFLSESRAISYNLQTRRTWLIYKFKFMMPSTKLTRNKHYKIIRRLFQTWLAYNLFKIHLPGSLLKNLVFATSHPFSLSCFGFLFATE